MNSFYIEYRDPLVGIIIFFVLIFVITFFSYWWGRYKKLQDSHHLDKFLQQFKTLPTENELQIMIQSGALSEKSWLLLASTFYKNGDYEKSIEIYNELIKRSDASNSRETMYLLGKTYFKAGFLERSKQIFLEILKNNPRTPQALGYLLLVYEYMRDYKSAQEVLEPLDELEKDIALESVYLQLLSLLHDMKLTTEEKISALVALYAKHHLFTYMIFEHLFRLAPKVAWAHFDSSKSEMLIDILWHVDAKNLDLSTIEKNGFLRELYTARGDVAFATRSALFELDVLIQLKKRANATLVFEYTCENCKQIFPFAFSRCSHCHSIDTSRVTFTLAKDFHKDFSEENNSFQ